RYTVASRIESTSGLKSVGMACDTEGPGGLARSSPPAPTRGVAAPAEPPNPLAYEVLRPQAAVVKRPPPPLAREGGRPHVAARLSLPMTTSPEFSFPVNELEPGGKSFQLPVRAAWLRGALEGTSIGAPERDGELELRLSRSGTDVVVRGALSSELAVPRSHGRARSRRDQRPGRTQGGWLPRWGPRTERQERQKAQGRRRPRCRRSDFGRGRRHPLRRGPSGARRARARRAFAGDSDDPLVFRGLPGYQP